MSFPRYPKYKASGMEWLRDVPERWGVARLKNVIAQKITDGPHTTPTFYSDGVPFLSVDGIQDGELQFEGCRFISNEDHAEFRRKALPRKGDLLLGKAASTGKLARVKVDFEFSIWSPLALIRLTTTKANPAFIEQWLKSPIAQAQIDNLCTSNTQKNISMDDIPRLIVTLPPLHEQTAIAEFLDRETGKIDKLVAEQRRLMELLKEKRQAVISHAVTKGLNPHAPMKPSGIEWLGDVPVGWVTGQMRYLAELIVDGTHHSPQSLPNGDYLYITAKNIKEHGFDLTEITYVTELQHREIFARCPVRKGDVLYIKDGATAGIAMVNPLEEEFSLLSSVALIRTIQSKLTPEFLAYQLNASQFKNPALNGLVGGAMTRFTLELISRFAVSVPPVEEQRAIVARLDIETAKFDTLTAEAQRVIDLLQERRTALISAAVTGQIDVRQQPRN